MSSPTYEQMQNLIALGGGGGGGGGGTSIDRELVVTTYSVKTAFTGASVGNTITSTQILDVSGATPTTVATIWRNQSTAADLGSAPSAANLSLLASTALTDTQLRAAALAVTVASLPLPTGAMTDAKGDAIIAKLSSDPATALGVAALLTNIVLAAGENHIGAVGGHSKVATATVTRPAGTVTYASGNVIGSGNAATMNAAPTTISVGRVNAGTGSIRRVRVSRSYTSAPGTDAVRVHFFRGTSGPAGPTLTNGDAGALAVNGVAAVHLGYVDVTLDRVFTDGAKGIGVPSSGGEITFDCMTGTTNLYIVLEARSAIAGQANEPFVIAAEVYQD